MKNLIKFSLLAAFVLSFAAACNCPDQGEQVAATDASTHELVNPEWSKNANIYEVNLRQYTQEGTINAFVAHMPRLKEMGVDVLWFMPIHPIGELNRKGGMGSAYSVKDYKAVNPDYGTLEDFNAMVAKAHELGMKVIIDWVANHSAWDNVWVETNPEFYTLDSAGNRTHPAGTDWYDTMDFNYDNKDMRAAMVNALQFWITDADIDGFRCDVAGHVPTDFWDNARFALDTIKPVFMLAEHEGPEIVVNAFDAYYAWDLHHKMNQIAKGEENVSVLDNYYTNHYKEFMHSDYPMTFTSNHDENSWNGTEFERMGDAAEVMSVLSYTVPGFPLIYSGQEEPLTKRLLFFEKDQIEWKNYEKADYYKKLNALKHNTEALWNGEFGGEIVRINTSANEQVFAFSREINNSKVVAVFNLSAKAAKFELTGEGYEGEYSEYFTKEKNSIAAGNAFEMEAWSYKLFINE